jgi:hypothetical protein
MNTVIRVKNALKTKVRRPIGGRTHRRHSGTRKISRQNLLKILMKFLPSEEESTAKTHKH